MKVKNRIKSNIEFGNVVKHGKTLKSNEFVIHFEKNNLSFIRVGISVSSKLGNAVTRNRIKRQIREMVASILDLDSASNDIVIIARLKFLNNDFQTNLSSLKTLLEKIGGNK